LRASGLAAPWERAQRLLQQSVAELRQSGARLELVRSLIELGAALRRAGERSEARGPLREALDEAERTGALQLAGRASVELEATGARRPERSLSGPDSLTPSERRVAELVAAGHTNREIAQTLFVAQRTVTTHVTHILRKLDVDRRELVAGALGAAVAPEPGPAAAAPRASAADLVPAPDPESSEPELTCAAEVARLSAAMATAADPVARARIATALAQCHFHAGDLAPAHAAAARALTELGADSAPSLIAPLQALLGAIGLLDRRFRRDLEQRLPLLRLVAVAAATGGQALRLLDIEWRRRQTLGRDDVLAELEQALTGGVQDGSGPEAWIALELAARLDGTGQCERLIDEVSRDPGIASAALALTWSSRLALRTGDVPTAVRDGRAAVEAAARSGLGLIAPLAAASLADALLARGRLGEAAATIEAVALDRVADTVVAPGVLLSRGVVRIARGLAREGEADLHECGELLAELGIDAPDAYPWRSAIGAEGLVEEELVLARRARSQRAIGVALRARARLLAGKARIECLRDAVDALSQTPARIESAGALLDLGLAQARAGDHDSAVGALRGSLLAGARCGATPLALRACAALAEVEAP
jgi:DNA-binding CsgD family transcriptional regulator